MPEADQLLLTDKCQIPPEAMDDGINLGEVSQAQSLENVFKNWHDLIKIYRGCDDQQSDEEIDRTQIQDEALAGNQAHFDVLAESICKLVA